MSYSRFFDSDIYIYSHVDGYIECCACWLNEKLDTEIFGLSEKIRDDQTLEEHIDEHILAGHNIPEGLLEDILSDDDRYGRIEL
jgi:hypothetical protein